MIEITRANFPEDSQIVANLFLGYLTFLFERAPEEKANIIQKYNPDDIENWVEKFSEIHARPKGELLIASHNGQAVGCAMMREMEPGIVEIQRVFVTDDARGLGVGKALTKALLDQAKEDGHKTARLDTGHGLVEAISLYENMGFQARSPYHEDSPFLDHLIRYYEREL